MKSTMKKKNTLRKASSTSSLLVGSTLYNPNPESITRAVSMVLASQMKFDSETGKQILMDTNFRLFSEDKYIFENPDDYEIDMIVAYRSKNCLQCIQDFFSALYDCTHYSPSCILVALIYIGRLQYFSHIPIHISTWRPLVLCALMIAQKVWDDHHLANSIFASMYSFFSKEELNVLEMKFLELIHFSISIRPSVYAKFFYEVRTLLVDQESEFPIKPLRGLEEKKIVLGETTYQTESVKRGSCNFTEK